VNDKVPVTCVYGGLGKAEYTGVAYGSFFYRLYVNAPHKETGFVDVKGDKFTVTVIGEAAIKYVISD
jgi:hypothetical protein